MTPIGRELTILGGSPVPVRVARTRGRAEPSPGKVRVQDEEGCSRGLLFIVGHVHHFMVEERGKMRREAGMEVQYHLIPLRSD